VGGERADPRSDLLLARARVGLERREHLACVEEARGRRARGRAEDDVVELRYDVAAHGARLRNVAPQDLCADDTLVVGLEEAAPREKLPHDDAGRVDVDLVRDRLAEELLGRHVGVLAAYLARPRRLELPERLRDAEVDDARNAIDADEDVLRRQV